MGTHQSTPARRRVAPEASQGSPSNDHSRFLNERGTAAAIHEVLRSPGQPLAAETRAAMEPRFGHDFSKVRIHADPQAAESARGVSAKAYTVGEHVVFGQSRYAPQSIEGQRLIAHELTHVVQQAGSNAGNVLQRDPDPTLPRLPDVQLTLPHVGDSVGWRRRLMPQPMLNLNILLGSPQRMDLSLLDQELTKGGPLTRTRGEIGYGTLWCGGKTGARSCEPAAAAQDSTLPIEAVVFPRTPPAAASTGAPGSSGGGGASPPTTQPATPSPAPRALVVGGIHGDEGGKPQHALIAERLETELNAGLSRDFDTILIPVMNPGGLADNQRTNRHGVDLNRNFPGLPNFPTGTPVVEQPETEAVKNVIQILRPSRILVLHAQGHANLGGVYADPVEGEARELACRMALRMRGSSGGKEAVVPGNLLDKGVCQSRYPDQSEVGVSTTQSSIGTWGSASRAAGGGGAVVITHEIPDKDNLKNPLPEHGAGRSVDSMMPGIREFLQDNRKAPSEADALLERAVTKTFLSGQDTPADAQLRATISGIVKARFDDMNAFYKGVWLHTQPAAVRAAVPNLTIVGDDKDKDKDDKDKGPHGVRDFSKQAGIINAEFKKSLNDKSSGSDIEAAILKAMETRSMPGFSRHHWGTDMDLVSAERTDWDPTTGRLRALIPFLQEHAYRFGFFHPYTAGYTRSGGQPAQKGFPTPTAHHYLEEPWHVSYWPLANVLQRLWLSTFTGPVLENLILETARAVHGPVSEADMAKALRSIGLSSFQSNVALSP